MLHETMLMYDVFVSELKIILCAVLAVKINLVLFLILHTLYLEVFLKVKRQQNTFVEKSCLRKFA